MTTVTTIGESKPHSPPSCEFESQHGIAYEKNSRRIVLNRHCCLMGCGAGAKRLAGETGSQPGSANSRKFVCPGRGDTTPFTGAGGRGF